MAITGKWHGCHFKKKMKRKWEDSKFDKWTTVTKRKTIVMFYNIVTPDRGKVHYKITKIDF